MVCLSSVNSENLWVDRLTNCLYAYNGDIGSETPPASQLWKFLPSGSSGSWQMVTSSPYGRVTTAAGTFGAGVGYALGGYKSTGTELNGPNPSLPFSGFIAYNSSTQTWSDLPVSGYDPNGISIGANLQYIPDYGKEGILLAMGGYSGVDEHDTSELISFGTTSVFDVATGKWGKQTTSGTIPDPRGGACTVGVQGDNGTFEASSTYVAYGYCTY